MDNVSLELKELRLLAKAEELEEQAKCLLKKARQYRVEASMLSCNLPQEQEIDTKIYTEDLIKGSNPYKVTVVPL